MSTGSYNEKRGWGQRHFGGWFGGIAVVCVLFAFFGQSAYAQVTPPTSPLAPPPGMVKFNSFEAFGTGCLPGTDFKPIISPGQLTLTLEYSDYTAEVGAGIPAIDARKNCNIILDIAHPTGFTFAISAVKFKGFANLDTGTEGTLTAQYFFQGQSPQVEFALQGPGPLVGDYETPDQKPTPTSGPVMFRPCSGGGALNINTEVRVQGGTGAMMADTTTGKFQQIYTLVWQSC